MNQEVSNKNISSYPLLSLLKGKGSKLIVSAVKTPQKTIILKKVQAANEGGLMPPWLDLKGVEFKSKKEMLAVISQRLKGLKPEDKGIRTIPITIPADKADTLREFGRNLLVEDFKTKLVEEWPDLEEFFQNFKQLTSLDVRQLEQGDYLVCPRSRGEPTGDVIVLPTLQSVGELAFIFYNIPINYI